MLEVLCFITWTIAIMLICEGLIGREYEVSLDGPDPDGDVRYFRVSRVSNRHLPGETEREGKMTHYNQNLGGSNG